MFNITKINDKIEYKGKNYIVHSENPESKEEWILSSTDEDSLIDNLVIKKAKLDLGILEKAADPLIKLLNDGLHPHVTCIVTPTSVELLESKKYVPNILRHLRD